MLALKWAVRDLRGGLHGLRLLFVCLLLGVATIAGIGSVSAALLAGLADKGQTLLGGDIELRLTQRTLTSIERAGLGAVGRLSTVARLNAIVANPRTDDAGLSELKAVDDAWPLYGVSRLQGGGAIGPALRNGGVALDPTLAERLRVKSGDTVRIGDGRFVVRGLIAEEPDRASQGFALGPAAIISTDDLARTGLAGAGSLIRYHYRLKLPDGDDPAGVLKALNARFPNAGWQANDRSDGAPGIRRFVEQIGQFLTLVGLTALLVAGVGVGNGVASYLARKTGSIATLKSLGAGSALILRVYLWQVLLVAMAAILLGLAIGALAPLVALQFLAGLLPIPPRVGLYPMPLLLAALQGLLIALLFALWPLASARRTPAARLFRGASDQERRWPERPFLLAAAGLALALAASAIWTATHQDLALGFVAAACGVLALLRLIGRLVVMAAARLPRARHPILRLAIGNLHRPGATTAPVVMALGLGLSLFATLAVIEANMRHEIGRTVPDTAPAYFFVDIRKDQLPDFVRAVSGIAGVRNVRTVPSLRGPITRVNETPAAEVKLKDPNMEWVLKGDRALTFSATLPVGDTLVAGRWWPKDYAGPPLISLEDRVARALGVGVGDTLTVSALGVDVTARISSLRRIDWDSFQFNFVMLFAPGTLEQAPFTYMATLEATPAADAAVFRRVTRDFPTVSPVRLKDVLGNVATLLGQIGVAVRAMSALTLFSGVLVLVGAVVAGRQARSYDAVVLKVLGATRGQILLALVMEYLLLGLATALIAILLGLAGGWYVSTHVLELRWTLPGGLLLATVGGGALATLVLGLAGAWSVLSARPAVVLRAA